MGMRSLHSLEAQLDAPEELGTWAWFVKPAKGSVNSDIGEIGCISQVVSAQEYLES